jgi:arylsulfatase A-like enzyme
MLCSLYPPLSYRSVTQERPAIDVPSLTSELKSLGHVNGLFYSADLRFQRSDVFLAHRGFDEVQDCRTIRRTRGGASADTSSAGGEAFASGDFADDADTVDAAVEWISARASRPFFAMVWTGNTHHPYVAPPGDESSFGVSDAAHNRYLNALRHADNALGSLLAALRRLGVEEDTLVVVVGDHGEAFGRHGQSGHASMLYEENVHVPFVLINPRLFKGETYDAVGGMVDVAPTVLDLMSLPAPPRWQGRSLFDPGRGGRSYFFAPWSDYLFGMRNGNFKTIYNATTGSHELYDLSADPRETKNLAADMPDVVNAAQQRLAAWVQFQGKLYRSLGDREQEEDAAAQHVAKD